ncbi:MAG: hypothetical protein ABL958_03020 [Bdellovibrionia bacterium]
MKALIATLIMIGSVSAQADGFKCETLERDLNVQVFHKVMPTDGTRNVAVMVISDPAVNQGRKTIARFQEINGVVNNSSATYSAKVDLRYADSKAGGELISGTKLGQLATIGLRVAFSYARPIRDGEQVPARLSLVKRDGQLIRRDLSCTRYLKGE